MKVWMQLKRLAPGVERSEKTDLCSQVLLVRRQLQQSLRSAVEQKIVDPPRIGERQRVEIFGKGEDHMEVRHRQELAATLLQPASLVQSLTLRTMAVPARVVTDFLGSARFTFVNVTAQGGGAANLDRSHCAQLGTAQSVLTPIDLAMSAKNVRQLETASPLWHPGTAATPRAHP